MPSINKNKKKAARVSIKKDDNTPSPINEIGGLPNDKVIYTLYKYPVGNKTMNILERQEGTKVLILYLPDD